MSTHTPAQAIQELVNHTAVLTERLVGLQGEVRKGMAMSPEWGNALTQVVGDTKRMLQAMEHLARLPAFHLDREGLNAAVAAGVQQGLAAESGSSLVSMIESNSRHLEEARRELVEAKQRMDQMLGEIQNTGAMDPESRQKFFLQIAPAAGVWSVAILSLGVLLGKGCAPDTPAAPQAPPAQQQQAPMQPTINANPIASNRPLLPPEGEQQQSSSPAMITTGVEVSLSEPTKIFRSTNPNDPPAYNAPTGARVRIEEITPTGWVRISFPISPTNRGTGWVQPGVLR